VTVLVDNEAGPGLAAEHGFSAWIEAAGRRILFDTGQGSAFAHNAERLGVDIGAADDLALSHGHYDHAGGLALALERARAVRVRFHPAATVDRYAIRAGTPKPIGMPEAASAALRGLPEERRCPVTAALELAPGIGLTGPIPRRTAYEDTGGPFFLDQAGLEPDPIEDDLALWIATGRGLVIVAGCCHAGLANTLHAALRASGASRVRAVIGGFHLLEASAERIERTARELGALAPDRVVACHCTGERAFRRLAAEPGLRVERGRSGYALALDEREDGGA
jgi:7,8-dihydropterin-6-yl-methyl-4-(beta-D-ribofuranosyl)aminobenzene 5'-phosphate synthase